MYYFFRIFCSYHTVVLLCLVLWCLTPLSTQFQLYCGGQFIGGGNGSTRRKSPTCQSQVTDKPYHIVLHRVHLTWARFKLTTLVVIGTDCTGSCKSNYHTITTTTVTIVTIVKQIPSLCRICFKSAWQNFIRN